MMIPSNIETKFATTPLNLKYMRPLEKGYTVYSKSNCLYCDKAKKLLENVVEKKLINCDDIIKEDLEGYFEYIKYIANTEYRFVPAVFKDGVFIGGYDKLVQEFNKS
uniref:Glutaredoxin domain-containing protein n=1 Tax=viral metagenome TaxID=1070528 RepID=A0A6C0J2J9_9ZZZZ